MLKQSSRLDSWVQTWCKAARGGLRAEPAHRYAFGVRNIYRRPSLPTKKGGRQNCAAAGQPLPAMKAETFTRLGPANNVTQI